MSRIHLSRAEIGDAEERYVLDALRSGWVAPLGPHVDAFEAEVAARCGVSGALALSSGTAALHLALLDAGARPGTVVAVSTLTFAASVNAITYTGAEAVLLDSGEGDGNLDVDLTIRAVDTLQSEGVEVAAVLAVDLFGRCVDYSRLEPALATRGVALVEDAAEALGSWHGRRAAGSFGRSAALSFNGNKILTTAGGGMLLSDDEELIERARYLSAQARHPVPWYEHSEVGFNYRMSNILAALGRGQLERLDAMITRRREIRDLYDKHLSGVAGIRVLGRSDGDEDVDDNCWLTAIAVDRPEPGAAGRPDDRDSGAGTSGVTVADATVRALSEADVEARHVWKPMHLQPLHRRRRAFLTGAADRLFERGVLLPSGAGLTDPEVLRVIDVLLEHLEGR